jgi:hypothetical protein
MQRTPNGLVTESKLLTEKLRLSMEECAALLVETKYLTDALAEVRWELAESRNDMQQRRPGACEWTSPDSVGYLR